MSKQKIYVWLSPRDLNPYDTTRQTFKLELERETPTEFVGRNTDRRTSDPITFPKFAWQRTAEII